MGSQSEDRGFGEGVTIRDPASTFRRGWVGPMVALGFTTICLAASAFRVVASAVVEEGMISAPPAPCARVAPLTGRICTEAEAPEIEPALASRPDDPPRPSQSPPPRTGNVQAATAPRNPDVSKAAGTVAAKKAPARPAPSQPKAATLASPTATLPPPPKTDAKRILVRDPGGKPVVARILGRDGDRTAAILPDGEVGWPDGLIFTERPFAPTTMEALKADLLANEYAGFQALETKHYLVLYQGSRKFAQDSVTTLENLYAKLSSVLNKRDVPVHEAEFPLVAVIYKTEDDFRRRKRVAPDVQAFYEILTNRIFLYESSKRDETAPEVSALRKPQTVAHEGTHQILQNIGVQPRLANWPLWLVEGLAEYCASPRLVGKNAVPSWVGLGEVNLLHIATIRELDDPLTKEVKGADGPKIRRQPGQTLVEYLVTRTELTPTDYALSWALTYHLALKRVDDFLDFVREMSRMEPLAAMSPQDHLRAFKAAFGENLGKLDAAMLGQIRKLRQNDALPYYAVMFEQPLPGGMLRRAGYVSQSPSGIRQWLDNTTVPGGADPRWQIVPQSSRARALLAVDQWMGNGS